MSVPTLTGITQIDTADTATNWTAYNTNSNKHAASTEVYLEGSGSNRVIFNSGNGDGQTLYDNTTGINMTTNLFFLWIFCVTPNQFDPWDQVPSGVYIRLGSTSGSNADYNDYYVGGNDIAWVAGGWHLVCVDANRTADRSSGTPDMTSVKMMGVGYANSGVTASQAPSIFFDNPMYGTQVEVTGPSHTDGTNGIDINSGGTIDRNDGGSFITDGWEAGDYVKISGSATSSNDGVWKITSVAATVLTTGETFTQDTANTTVKIFCSVTFEDIYQKDGPTDDNWWGVVSKDVTGNYIINYPLVLGDESGALDLFFLSRGDVVTLADQALGTTREDYIKIAEDTGETHIQIGDSSGTGDDRTGYNGSTFVRESTIYSHSTSTGSANTPAVIGLDFSANVTSFELYGSTFVNLDPNTQAIKFGTSSNHYIASCTFNQCGQIDINTVETQRCFFLSTKSTAGSTIWGSTSTDLERSSFIANTTGPAIEHNTANSAATGTVTTQDLTGVTLTDSAASFLSTVAVGDVAYNETDNSYANVLSVDSDNQLTTDGLQGGSDNDWASSDVYSVVTPYTYTDLVFSSNTYDVDNTVTGDDAIAITKVGTSDPSSYPTGDHVAIQSSVTLTVTVKDTDGAAVGTAQTAIYKTSDRSELMNEDTNASGIATETYIGTTPVEVEVRVRKASSGATKYKNYSSTQTVGSGGLDLAVTLEEDPNNNATS